MNQVIAVPDHLYNCPICNQACTVDEESGYNTVLRVQGQCQVFLCINPLVENPLHYYSHIVETAYPDRVAYQEFSLDLGSKHVLFSLNYKEQKSIIKSSKDANPLSLDFIITPDFPNLDWLKRKVQTSITFS